MSVNRRTFMLRAGRAAVGLSVTFAERPARARVPAGMSTSAQSALEGFDPRALSARVNADPEFGLAAREWDALVQLGIDDHHYGVSVRNGRVVEVAPASPGADFDVRIAGPLDAWRHGFGDYGLRSSGDDADHRWPYQAAILRLAALVRETLGAPIPEHLDDEVDREFDSIVGRYVYVRIRGIQYRVYFEETGQGMPMVLQHTAGSDSRQWRHLLEDRELQQRFRMIAYDLPFHGRSLPPTTDRWWTTEYRMDTQHLMDSIVAISNALNLERPVYMGCSVGGYLAPDLAYYHPDKFRAVIGINSSIAGTRVENKGKPYASPFSHPQNSTAYIGSRMYMITSPEAREAFRRETGWIYSQGGPGIFGGDLYYFSVEHDLRGKAHTIDTSRVGVHLLSGEYDPTARGPAESLAAMIDGATYDVIEGGSHFAMSDDYPRFRRYLLPVLDRVYRERA